MTPLDKTLKRAVRIKGIDYVVTLSPDALKLTRKGKRLGMELKWEDITSGESALAIALHASVGRFDAGKAAESKPVVAVPGAKSPLRRKRGTAPRPVRKKRPA